MNAQIAAGYALTLRLRHRYFFYATFTVNPKIDLYGLARIIFVRISKHPSQPILLNPKPIRAA
jgi:hypothetical protein